MSDSVIVALLVWQALTTVLSLTCCGLYICKWKNKGPFHSSSQQKVNSADAYIVRNINSVTTENVTEVDRPSYRSAGIGCDRRGMDATWALG